MGQWNPGCEQRGLQRATRGWEDPFWGVEQEEGAEPHHAELQAGGCGEGAQLGGPLCS